MNIERKDLENSIVELVVEESTENVAKARKNALKHLQENAEVKGFRKWAKIPEDVIVRQYGEDHINKMAIDYSIEKMYKDAIKKEKLVPVAQWVIKEIISQSPLKIKIHIEVLPKVEINDDYKKISLEKKEIEVSDKEVKAALEDIEKRFTKFEEITDKRSKLKMWDRATIDTQWFENWELLDNTSMQDYPLVLGSNILVPGFEEQIVWAKLWDELEIDVNFPEDYHNKDFANKKTKFKVTIKKFERWVKPEFSEEFIEQLRGKKLDLNGFKDLLKEEIRETKESNARMEEESKLIDELLKVSKLEVGENLLKNQIEKVYTEIKENMASQNIKVADYLESLKMSEEEYKEKHVKETALKRLQWELILHKLWELEKVEVSEDEMKEEIEKIMSRFENKEVLERLKELYIPWTKYYEELKQRMVYKKLIESFFNKK